MEKKTVRSVKVADSKKTIPELKLPSLEDLLAAGVHFGHRSSTWNPKMKPYIYGERNGVHIIDLIKTLTQLKVAIAKIQSVSQQGTILIVGTKGQAASMVSQLALQKGAFYVNKRWPGGLFTNFKAVKKSIDKLIKMEQILARGGDDLVKKEQLLMKRDVERLNNLYEGLKFMDKLPSLVIVIDSKVEKNAIRESRAQGIPVVALVDTNCDPEIIDFPIAANEDSIKSISLFVELFGQAIEGTKYSKGIIEQRTSHITALENAVEQHKQEIERIRAMEEEEKERIKALRKGEEVESKVLRVIERKSDSQEFPFSPRITKALQTAGYKTMGDIKGLSKKQLSEIKGIGAKALEEILKNIK